MFSTISFLSKRSVCISSESDILLYSAISGSSDTLSNIFILRFAFLLSFLVLSLLYLLSFLFLSLLVFFVDNIEESESEELTEASSELSEPSVSTIKPPKKCSYPPNISPPNISPPNISPPNISPPVTNSNTSPPI